MIRITLQYVYGLAESMEQIAKLTPGMNTFDYMLAVWGAQSAIEVLLTNSVLSPHLRSSRPLADALLALIKAQGQNRDWDRKIEPGDVFPIATAFSQFKTALLAEIGTLPSYLVSQKGSHDTLTLLDQPWRMFPSDLPTKVPEAMFDVAEAGKALCYETATACGFHLFRATESVLRRYYSHVTGGRPQPKMRNIMVYINAMRQSKCGEERILSVLEQMSKLHRNPLIHPEVALSPDEAISLLGMAHSAITAMLSVLPIPPATTTASAAAQPASVAAGG